MDQSVVCSSKLNSFRTLHDTAILMTIALFTCPGKVIDHITRLIDFKCRAIPQDSPPRPTRSILAACIYPTCRLCSGIHFDRLYLLVLAVLVTNTCYQNKIEYHSWVRYFLTVRYHLALSRPSKTFFPFLKSVFLVFRYNVICMFCTEY